MKRLQWAKDKLSCLFEDVIWTDECTFQLEIHHTCRKKGQPAENLCILFIFTSLEQSIQLNSMHGQV